jgi:hypothetical protein
MGLYIGITVMLLLTGYRKKLPIRHARLSEGVSRVIGGYQKVLSWSNSLRQ